MKRMRTALTVFAAFVLATALAIPAFAQDVPVTGTPQGTGSITITNPSPEADYRLYRIFGAKVSPDGKNVVYTGHTKNLTAGGIDGSQWFSINNNYEITPTAQMSESVLNTADFKKWAVAYGSRKAGPVKGIKGESLVFTDVPEGYYFIVTTLGNKKVTVTTAKPSAEVIEKNQGPTLDNGDDGKGKVVLDANNNKVKLTTAMLDVPLTYDIGINATNFDGTKKVYGYNVGDVLAKGMTYDPATFKVMVGTTEVKPIAQQATTGYTLQFYSDEALTVKTNDVASARGFKVLVPWTANAALDGAHLYAAATELHVSYQAKLDSAKAAQIVYDDKPNTNKSVSGWFAEDPNTPPPPPPTVDTDPTGRLPETKADVYTAQVMVHKFAMVKDPQQQNQLVEKVLNGAEFTLTGTNGFKVTYTYKVEYVADNAGTFWKLKDGSYTQDNPNDPDMNKDLYEDTTQKYAQKVTDTVIKEATPGTTMKAEVNKDGNAYFKGLGEATYTLEETKVPAGFNKAANVVFTIKYNTDPGQGAIGWLCTDNAAVTYTDVPNPDYNPAVQGSSQTMKAFKTSIENKAGIALPNTGGLGRTLLLAAGALLAIAGTVSVIVRRRANKAGASV